MLALQCHKNFKMKRNPKKLRWTKGEPVASVALCLPVDSRCFFHHSESCVRERMKAAEGAAPNAHGVCFLQAFRRATGRELTMDKTLEFEKRRNRPVKYNRELWEKTVHAIQKVEEVKAAREKRMYQRRMMGARKKNAMEALETIKKHNSVVEGPLANFKPTRAAEGKVKEKPFSMKMDMSDE